MKALIRWFAGNDVVANALLFGILAMGLATVSLVKREVIPAVDSEFVSVSVRYRGAAPEEVEQAICVRVEEAVQGISGIDRIVSTASEGSASIQIEVMSGFEPETILEDVKTMVGTIDTFPEDAEEPVVQYTDRSVQVINVSVAADTDLATLRGIGERVRDDLAALPEISQIQLVGVPDYEISIEVSEEALRRWGLTLDVVAEAVRRSSVDVPGGSVVTERGEILLRTKGQAYTGQEYENLPLLSRPDGTKLLLSDVATVVDGFGDAVQYTRFNGTPALVLGIYRVGGQSVDAIAEAVHAYVAEASARVPDGVTIATSNDQSVLLKSRIDLLAKNAVTGLILVFVVLALFLRLQLAIWVTIGIPVSFLGTIALMPVWDVSISMISLFTFILVLGIVVDDAIVVGEHIHSKQLEMGRSVESSTAGAYEVLVPVTFGVLTTMTAFAPMLFVVGNIGQILSVIPMVAIPALFFSLVESNLILPSHLAYGGQRKTSRSSRALSRHYHGFFDLFSNGLDWFIARVYGRFLPVALDWRYLVIAVAIGTLLLTAGLILGNFLPIEMIATVESDFVVGFIAMPQEASVSVTAAAVDRLESTALELREELRRETGTDLFLNVISSVGSQPYKRIQASPMGAPEANRGEHLGEVQIELLSGELRNIPSSAIAARWREKSGRIPGAVEQSISYDLFSDAKPIDVELTSVDIGELQVVAEALKTRLESYPGVFEISDTYRGGKPEVQLSIKSEGQALGLTLQGLGRQVRQAFLGEEAQRVQRGRDDIRVMVRFPEGNRRSLGELEQMRIRTLVGDQVPFSTVAEASMVRAPATITRVDRRRSINVQAHVDSNVTSGTEVLGDLDAGFLPDLMAQHPGVNYAFEGEDAALVESLTGLFWGFGAATFLIFVMLAIPLRSYIEPILVVVAIPFGMVGALWGHWLFGISLSFLSMCGMVALAGVVVNDSLVLVTFIKNYRSRYDSLRDAVAAAGRARFRAILLTSLTTSAGVTPLLLEKSVQAKFLIPMAVALSSGVLFATAVTLVLLPSLYLVLEDVRRFNRWLWGLSPKEGGHTTTLSGIPAGD